MSASFFLFCFFFASISFIERSIINLVETEENKKKWMDFSGEKKDFFFRYWHHHIHIYVYMTDIWWAYDWWLSVFFALCCSCLSGCVCGFIFFFFFCSYSWRLDIDDWNEKKNETNKAKNKKNLFSSSKKNFFFWKIKTKAFFYG